MAGYSSTMYTMLPLWYTNYVKEGLQFLTLASQVAPQACLNFFGIKQPDAELQREQLRLGVINGRFSNLAALHNLPDYKKVEGYVPLFAGYSLLCRSSMFVNKFGHNNNIVF